MGVRIADAMLRGKVVGTVLAARGRAHESDLLGFDWFTIADAPLAGARASFGVPSRSEPAVTAGSVSPWEPGGISEYQFWQGQRAAHVAARRYDSFGAVPPVSPADACALDRGGRQ
jgi:hypothetical protein